MRIEKADGELVDFSDVLNESINVEIGDRAVYQPIREYNVINSLSPVARREMEAKEREHL